MVNNYEQCTRNISPSTCTEYVTHSTRDRSNICSEHCQHCSYFINDHTYSILKKLCRRLIKNYNAAENRERYTVFEGGNSINVRIRRASTNNNEVCGSRNEGVNEIYRSRDYCRSTSAYNSKQTRQQSKKCDNLCRNCRDDDFDSGWPSRKCRNKFDTDDDETTRPKSCGRNWQPDGESYRSKDQKFVKNPADATLFDGKTKDADGSARNKRSSKSKTTDNRVQGDTNEKKKYKSPRRYSSDNMVHEDKYNKTPSGRKGIRNKIDDSEVESDLNVDDIDDGKIKRSTHKRNKQPKDDDEFADSEYRRRKNRFNRDYRDYEDEEDELIGTKNKIKKKKPKIPADELDENVKSPRKKRPVRDNNDDVLEYKDKMKTEKVKKHSFDGDGGSGYEDKFDKNIRDVKRKDRDNVITALYNQDYDAEEPGSKRTPKKKGKEKTINKQPPTDDELEGDLKNRKKHPARDDVDEYYDKNIKGPKYNMRQDEDTVLQPDDYLKKKTSKLIKDKEKKKHMDDGRLPKDKDKTVLDDGNANTITAGNANVNDRFIKGRSLKKKKEEEIVERKWEDDFDSGGKTRVQDIVKSSGKKSKGKRSKHKNIFIEIVETPLPDDFDKVVKIDKGKSDRSDKGKIDKRDKDRFDKPDIPDAKERPSREIDDDGTEVVYYKRKGSKRRKSQRNRYDDDDGNRHRGKADRSYKSPPKHTNRMQSPKGKKKISGILDDAPIITDLRRKVRSGQNITAERTRKRQISKSRHKDGAGSYCKSTRSSSRNRSLSSAGRIRGLTERYRNLETNDADYLRAVMEQRELCFTQSQQICDPCQPKPECLKQDTCICTKQKDDCCRIPCFL